MCLGFGGMSLILKVLPWRWETKGKGRPRVKLSVFGTSSDSVSSCHSHYWGMSFGGTDPSLGVETVVRYPGVHPKESVFYP